MERVAAELAAMVLGPAHADGIDMGPLVTQRQLDRVLGYIESGHRQGATLVTGGSRPGHLGDGGFFVERTLFSGVSMDMRIAREEISGPVVSVLEWSDYEAMVAQVNEADYGLTASIWTRDLNLAHHTAARVEAGYVWINDARRHYWGVPFGGTKDSGVGKGESVDELRGFLRIKAVNTILDPPAQR